MIVYQLKEDKYLLVVNASNIKKDWEWISKQNRNFKADISDISEKTALLAIQGPKALEAMQSLCDIDLTTLGSYCHMTIPFAGCDEVLVATTGYTGSGGIEIYFETKYAEIIWEKVMDAGTPFGILPIGLAARDTLRLEMGYCLYGNEINDATSPVSAGLKWVTKTETKFLSHELHQQEIEEGTDKKLIGFEMVARGIPRSGYEIFDEKSSAKGRAIRLSTHGHTSLELQFAHYYITFVVCGSASQAIVACHWFRRG